MTKSILQAGKHAYSEKPLVLTLEEGTTLRDLATVSYTHLDVYKRQTQVAFNLKKGSMPVRGDVCLLYTSRCV